MDTETTSSIPDLFFMFQMLAFVICLILSAIFSGSETALTSMTKFRIKRLFGEDEEGFAKLESWLKKPNQYLATILIGNNFVNTLASVLAAHICETILQWFRVSNVFAFGSAVAVAVTTFMLLVFGEIVPKTYCKEHAVRISQLVIKPLDLMYRCLRPLIGMFVFISNLFIRLMGGPKIKDVPLLTENDVRTLIELSEKEGVLEEEEREMIHSIIDFGDTLVKEILTPRVDFQVISCDLSLEEVRQEALSKGYSRIPVYEEEPDKIIGILYVKDLLMEKNGGEKFDLKAMLRPALFVPRSKKVMDLLETFKKEKTHLAIVVDEYGVIAGLVTIEDVIEEIVGDIQDEYDEESPEYERQKDGSIIADAKINLDELVEILEINFHEEDVETLGGFLFSLFGDVPSVNEKVEYEGYKFTVLEADERRIDRVNIQRLERDKNSDDSGETDKSSDQELS